MKLSKTVRSALLWGILMFAAAGIGQSTAYGYIHGADIFIVLAAMALPLPYGAVAAGVTGVAADLMKGYFFRAPATLLIKPLTVWAAQKLTKLPMAQKHPECLAGLAVLVPVLGYYLFEVVMQFIWGNGLASFGLATATFRKDLVQAGGSYILMIFFYDIYMGIKAAKEGKAE